MNLCRLYISSNAGFAHWWVELKSWQKLLVVVAGIVGVLTTCVATIALWIYYLISSGQIID